jgi:hypothetical protein
MENYRVFSWYAVNSTVILNRRQGQQETVIETLSEKEVCSREHSADGKRKAS